MEEKAEGKRVVILGEEGLVILGKKEVELH